MDNVQIIRKNIGPYYTVVCKSPTMEWRNFESSVGNVFGAETWLSSFDIVQNGSETRPAFYPMGTKSFPECIADRSPDFSV